MHLVTSSYHLVHQNQFKLSDSSFTEDQAETKEGESSAISRFTVCRQNSAGQ